MDKTMHPSIHPMALKVEVYQKEKVRPCSPTPQSLRNYKLSLLDILISIFYTPIVFFYDSRAGGHDYDELKDSLMKTLSVWYPLAGRIKDGTTIECNDEGADFVRAKVTNCDLGEFLRHPKLEDIRQMLPLDPYPNAIHPALPMLAVQLNRFRCGGTAVAFCVWHGLADASAMMGLFNTLAAFNRGEGPINPGGVIVDASAIFRPGNIVGPPPIPPSLKNRGKYSSKRFVFGKQDIERLRNDYYHPSEHPRRPSRVEALSAFIWAAVIKASLLANPNLKMHLLAILVNLRNKLNPPFPSHCLGNIMQAVAARWESEADGGGRVTPGFLVGRVAEAIHKVTDNYLREMHAEGGYLKALLGVLKGLLHNVDETKTLNISSLCNILFSQVDFGWGKPKWIGLGHTMEDSAMFMDAEDGGVEVWIGLTEEVMHNLDKDMKFHGYVSFSQMVSEPSCQSAVCTIAG
ncbi:stemmadenine O-acetyltransferase-like [Ipomoea triloba]|uniref:stemmadenine O-acetyltransferase-like n=1 Tax=Ipomoea triloba TaxID=35885 RepID=UPI00125DFF88|nr:stemmadenine O-acetyltransferase-like [Ipomoea triloba]